jgi:carbonic anhydrase
MMRTYPFLLSTLCFVGLAWANDPAVKPIKPTQTKEVAKEATKETAKEVAKETSKEEAKPSLKELKESREAKKNEAARLKETQASDELAAKIAERVAAIRKEEDGKSSQRPAVRGYAPPIRRPDSLLVKSPAKKTTSSTVAAAAKPISKEPWAYAGETGPHNWAKLDPANALCETGQRQSPVDIKEGLKVELETPNFDYKSKGFTVVDDGYTLSVSVDAGNFFTIMGRQYELQQFHFHRPSEETINGKGTEMVVHLVHKDRENKIAVVAVLLDIGKANSAIQQVWNHIPLEKKAPLRASSNLDVNQFLPQAREYYVYMGSLTTPPCSEGVVWVVMKEVMELSADQAAIFARLYPMNARPIQKSAGRVIKESK